MKKSNASKLAATFEQYEKSKVRTAARRERKLADKRRTGQKVRVAQ